MSLDKKYNIPSETIKKMVSDGVISCSVARHYEIYDFYITYRQQNPKKKVWDLYMDVSEKLHVHIDTVRKVVYELGKKS